MNRRSFALSATLAALLLPAGLSPAAAASDHPAVKFTRQLADELIRAQMVGTVPRFTTVIRRHADIPGISMYTLGNYSSKLPKGKTDQYYKGITAYIAHYFANQTRKYRVLQANVTDATKGEGDLVVVNALATLEDGNKYRVQFMVRPASDTWKVVDVKVGVPVLGFVSLTYGMRGDVQRFLAKKGGDVNALIAALNR
jgi:phospholipid transport system substrate-binding protein